MFEGPELFFGLSQFLPSDGSGVIAGAGKFVAQFLLLGLQPVHPLGGLFHPQQGRLGRFFVGRNEVRLLQAREPLAHLRQRPLGLCDQVLTLDDQPGHLLADVGVLGLHFFHPLLHAGDQFVQALDFLPQGIKTLRVGGGLFRPGDSPFILLAGPGCMAFLAAEDVVVERELANRADGFSALEAAAPGRGGGMTITVGHDGAGLPLQLFQHFGDGCSGAAEVFRYPLGRVVGSL